MEESIPFHTLIFFNVRGQQKEKVVVQEREDRKGKRGEGKRERNVPPSIPLIYSSFFFLLMEGNKKWK